MSSLQPLPNPYASLAASHQRSESSNSIVSDASSNNTAVAISQSKSSSSITSSFVTPKPIIFDEEYLDEAIEHMRAVEATTLPNLELMNAQPELRWFMRPYLVDFIVEIHQTFRLRPETLFLTMNIADRYVSRRIVFKRHYQLVGSAALLLAAKYEDAKDRVPTVADLSSMCCQAYDESAFIQMEGHILQTLNWQLGHPTPEAWLRLYCMQTPEEQQTQNVARFLMENTLFHREFVGVPSSLLASGALMLSRYICNKEARAFAAEEVEEVASVAQLIDSHLSSHLQDLSLILIKKYSYQHFSAASTVVRNFYLTGAAAQKKASTKATGSLLPAHSLTVTVQHSDDIDDADCSMDSDASTSSSLTSTPSRSEDEDDDEDEDEDMPVTPLSAFHDLPMSVPPMMPSPTKNKSGDSLRALPVYPRPGMKGSDSYNRLPTSGSMQAVGSRQHWQSQPRA